jgi:hypothetical protein
VFGIDPFNEVVNLDAPSNEIHIWGKTRRPIPGVHSYHCIFFMKNVVCIVESLHISYPDDPIWKKVYMASSGDISIFREYAPVHGHLTTPKDNTGKKK